MSHHFDNPNARDDPRLNVNDFYLVLERAPGRNSYGDDGKSRCWAFRSPKRYGMRASTRLSV